MKEITIRGILYKVGDDYPVWWDTNDGRASGKHMARILEIKAYTGHYKFIKCIFKLTANTLSSSIEMCIEG